MKISIIGGGPGGLYFALLAKKRWPRWEIAVHERNRADDTFGFGVVFSDATLGTFHDYDPPSYESIRRRFAYWDDVEIVYKGRALRCGGNGFCGCSRVTLLKLLQARCRELGVDLRFQSEASVEDFPDSDLIVAADGINSRTREVFTAHFSIGSGTKLAMEDAIALFDSLRTEGGVTGALALYDSQRREDVEKTQHAADVSLAWFENMRRYWAMDPPQFAFGVISRSKQITYENVRLRDPGFLEGVTRWFADTVLPPGFEVHMRNPPPPMFTPFALRGMRLENRVVVSPMDQYMAVDGIPNDWHLVHLGSRAVGGAGLVFIEMTCPSPEARISPGCTGLWNETQRDAFKRIVDFCHAQSGAKLCMQLGHAGRKGSTQLGWERIDYPLESGNWGLVAPSPLPYQPQSQTPRELTRADMDRIRDDFVRSARYAEAAGFDMLELHMAHGYLLSSFISPLTNLREDEYGGPIANRLRYPLELFRAVRAVWPVEKPMSIRISATDWAPGGLSEEDLLALARAFKEAGVDLIDVSTG